MSLGTEAKRLGTGHNTAPRLQGNHGHVRLHVILVPPGTVPHPPLQDHTGPLEKALTRSCMRFWWLLAQVAQTSPLTFPEKPGLLRIIRSWIHDPHDPTR